MNQYNKLKRLSYEKFPQSPLPLERPLCCHDLAWEFAHMQLQSSVLATQVIT